MRYSGQRARLLSDDSSSNPGEVILGTLLLHEQIKKPGLGHFETETQKLFY